MVLTIKGRKKQLISRTRGSHLARATFRILLYLWQASLFMARHTYHFSSARMRQLKMTRDQLLRAKTLDRKGLLRFAAAIAPLNTSWQLVKSIENIFCRHIFGSSNVNRLRLHRASQFMWKFAKHGGKLHGMCDFNKWKRHFQRVSGIDLATRAINRLSRIGRSRGWVRRRMDRRSFKGSGKSSSTSSSHKDRGRHRAADERSGAEMRAAHSKMSWGELVHCIDGRYNTVLKQYNYRLALYRKMPWKSMSRLWGQFNQLELPTWLRGPALRLYIWMFDCSLEEAAVQDLNQYRNLSEFFRRVLRPGIRPIDGAHILTSPADGKILHCGAVQDGVLEQVKGVNYSLFGFLGPVDNLLRGDKVSDCNVMATSGCNDELLYRQLLSNPQSKLFHCVIYLAPGDYHRFHSPTDWTVYARRHFPGELFSVNPGIARWLQGVFNFNERVVYVGKWNHGFFSMTAVGATNVGSINVSFDKTLSTNTGCKWPSGCYYDDRRFASETKRGGNISLGKGEFVGDFNLGSTIVLLFEAPECFLFRVAPGQRLRYGQGIGGCSRQLGNRK